MQLLGKLSTLKQPFIGNSEDMTMGERERNGIQELQKFKKSRPTVGGNAN